MSFSFNAKIIRKKTIYVYYTSDISFAIGKPQNKEKRNTSAVHVFTFCHFYCFYHRTGAILVHS